MNCSVRKGLWEITTVDLTSFSCIDHVAKPAPSRVVAQINGGFVPEGDVLIILLRCVCVFAETVIMYESIDYQRTSW